MTFSSLYFLPTFINFTHMGQHSSFYKVEMFNDF